VGHVLLELKKKSETTYESIFHIGLMGFNFQNLYNAIEIKDGQIPVFGFFKSGEKSISETKSYDFKILDEKTNYIKLSSFNGSLKDELNMFYDSIEEKITSKPYLIIDLRDNGGGSEQCYFNLLPYIYTKPLQIDSVEVWVSPENIKRYEENPSDFNSNLIARMKQAEPFTFIPQVENAVTTWVLDSVTTYPQKIVLLFNKNTASAAEGLITYSMQSDKVVTMGENSGGYIGYGNVMETKIPCGKFTLTCTTTKYSKNSKYEFIGIEPMHLLSPKKDWLNYAQSFLHNQK
jgi:C-terminal processing protease CtpA/Prc